SRKQIVDHSRNLTLGEAGRMRVGRYLVAELGGGEAVAALVVVGVFVEVRHLGAGPPTGDHLDQLLMVETRLVQIRRLAGRARIAVAVAIDAMTELAVGLFVIEAIAERRVLRADSSGQREQRNNDKRLSADHTCRSTIMRLISAIALAGLRLFGHALAQFMMVWQR